MLLNIQIRRALLFPLANGIYIGICQIQRTHDRYGIWDRIWYTPWSITFCLISCRQIFKYLSMALTWRWIGRQNYIRIYNVAHISNRTHANPCAQYSWKMRSKSVHHLFPFATEHYTLRYFVIKKNLSDLDKVTPKKTSSGKKLHLVSPC